MTRRPAVVHLCVRTEDELGSVTRYKAPCGASGIDKRAYATSADKVTCTVCNSKIKRKKG